MERDLGCGDNGRSCGFPKVGRPAGKRGMSIIVSDANAGARRLYERCGYSEAAFRPMVKAGWVNPGENWVLLTKAF